MALIEGCVVQAGGLAVTAVLIGLTARPTMAIVGSGFGMLATTQQVANGAGVVLVSAVFFAVQAGALSAAIGFLHRMRVPSLAAAVP